MDHQDGNDPYAAAFAQMKAGNERAIDDILKTARAARAEAADLLADAKVELLELENSLDKFAAKCAEEHRLDLEKDLLRRVKKGVAEQLLRRSTTPEDVAALLEMPDEEVREIAESVAFSNSLAGAMPVLIGEERAWLEYEDSGRGGYIIFHWGGRTNRFWWEFGTGNALVLVDIPSAESWEGETGIPLRNRAAALEYIGRKTSREQGNGDSHFRIEEKQIVLLRKLGEGKT